MPSSEGDAQIQLVQKAYTKLQSFHTLFGEDSQVFTEDEEVMHYGLNQQINGEESPFEKYVFELKEYRHAHPERFAQIAETENGLELALEFELMWLKSKRRFYSKIKEEDEQRIIDLENRMNI